jgi:hypothetical protein
VLKEQEARLEEVQTYVTRNQTELQHLKDKLVAYYQAQSSPPSGVMDSLISLGESLADFGGAYVSAAKGADFDKLVALAKAGKSLYDSLDKVASLMSGSDFVCTDDPKCKALTYDIAQARVELYASNQAVGAAIYAVQAAKADQALFEARRALAKDIAQIYQGNHFEVRDYDALSRAGRYLCQYGRLVTDSAAADLHAFKRSAAGWDVPTPSVEQSEYDGTGGRYDFDFLSFLKSDCKSLNCTLWGDYVQFLAARLQQGPPNSAKVSIGGSVGEQGQALAALLHNPPVPGPRVEFAFGLMQVANATGGATIAFGARPTPFALDHGAVAIAPVFATLSFEKIYATQLRSVTLRAYDASNQPVRTDFPFRVSRPSSERYVTQLTPSTELDLEVAVPAGRELDGGQLLDRLSFDQGAGGFHLELCCDGGNKWARPEALLKSWTLWVPLCEAGAAPSQECAGSEELAAIQRVELEAQVSYKKEP